MSFSGWPKGYKVAVTGAALLGLIALTVVITLAIERRAPAFTRIGTAQARASITLRELPTLSAPASGTVNAGESVELLEHLPGRSLDEWTLIRSAAAPKTYGYARLSDLDHLKTSSSEFDVWHAVQSLKQAKGAALKGNLSAVDLMIRATPLLPSSETDALYRELALESVRLARESTDNVEDARSAVTSAEAYLGKLSVHSQEAPETAEIRSAIQAAQAVIGEAAEPEQESVVQATPAPAPPSPRAEMTRLLREANTAFAAGRYAKVVELSQQIAAKGQGKRDVASIVDQAKALQKKAETAQEEYEKTNIQNR